MKFYVITKTIGGNELYFAFSDRLNRSHPLLSYAVYVNYDL